ncbi:MAG TPA: hypothetical protein VFG93_01365 [Gaiellaceae bacterium]|nr:hypothetical protein [Gaiellaceae bacterium]
MPDQKVAIEPDGDNPSFGQGLKSALRSLPTAPQTGSVPDDVLTREDVDAIVAGIWDIKMLLLRLVQLFGDDEEEEDQ